MVESAGAQTLTMAVAGLALVFGSLGAALAAFTLLRGSPARLEAQTHECVTLVDQMKGQWEAARSGLDALLDSIHTERENVQKANNRLSARNRTNDAQPQRPLTRDETLAHLRREAGIT